MLPSSHRGNPPPPAAFPHSSSFVPASENRGIPQRKDSQYQPSPSSDPKEPSNGAPSWARQVRPLTVDEALQYSSLSSIVPFDTSIIPIPNAVLPHSAPVFSTPVEAQGARASLDRLNETLVQTRGNSEAAQHALQNLRALLHPKNVTTFQFKAIPTLSGDSTRNSSTKITNGHKPPSRLTPVANMVLNSANISFRYPTPSSPEPQTSKKYPPVSVVPVKLPVTPHETPVATHNINAFAQNSIAPTASGLPSNSPQNKQQQIQVVLPSPEKLNRSEYKVISDEPVQKDQTPSKSKKRKRDERDVIDSTTLTKDQRALSDASLITLNELIYNILEAEINWQGEFESATGINDTDYLTNVETPDGSMVTLTPSINTKLDSYLHKVITLGRYDEVSVDHICKLQRLCEGALSVAESTDIKVQPDWSDDEALVWLQKLEIVNGALRSARTVLRTMTGGCEEKRIYSEELLQKVFDLLCRVMDTCIIPVVESRTQSGIFEAASAHTKTIQQLLHNAGKLMTLLLDLLRKVELAEGIITSIEFFVTRLMFIENAHTEKESVLGIHKFESFRRTAMNMIAEIFSRYPDQRRFILDEILVSLQKLPVNRQQARQYKLDDGTAVQLVSALLMRLVQSSGTRSSTRPVKRQKRTLPTAPESSEASEDNRSSSESDEDADSESDSWSNSVVHKQAGSVPRHLIKTVRQLYDSAVTNAQYIIEFFVQRASTASKSGDEPHRLLLDMFVGDLVAVLNCAEWPAAEVLLRALVARMDRIISLEKSSAPSKTMALEVLGIAGSAISDVTFAARQLAKVLENEDSKISERLTQCLDDSLTAQLEEEALLTWTGPYRMVIEYLSANNSDPQATGARDYYLTQWAKLLLWGTSPTSGDPEVPPAQIEVTTKVCKMTASARWITDDEFESVNSTQCRLAHIFNILNLGFCRAFGQILHTLLKWTGSDQPTVRNRSLKSVTQMLEKDPTLLQSMPQVMRVIIKCASDKSILVRDSSLALIGKCIVLQPSLERSVLEAILTFTNDEAPAIRKRAMKLLKDIYLRNRDQKLRTDIAENLLQRMGDVDESVSELARQIFEDIWLTPFWTISKDEEKSVRVRIALKEQVGLIIRTVQRDERTGPVLESLLSQTLNSKSKDPSANIRACKAMVAAMFAGMIDYTELPGSLEQRDILRTLTIFAKAKPVLFTQQQLEHLKPYISNLSNADDLNLFRSVVIILRCVLPTLPAVQKEVLKEVQEDLLKSVAKLAKNELNEVVSCLWTINKELQNVEKLVNMEIGVLQKLYKSRLIDFSGKEQQQELSKVKRIILIAAHFAKYCDFQPQRQRFSSALAWWAGDTVADCVVDTIMPYSGKHQPLGLRSVAFESIGMVCQAWPKNFNRAEIARTFLQVLKDDDAALQKIVLSSFRDFFAIQDYQVEARTSSTEHDPLANGKLGGSMIASDNDGAAALIAQGFLKDILRIALSSQDEYALTATEVVASITRQGLVHPKECGPALVALETSTNPKIADIAFQQHSRLHQQHESMFEREYMRAIQEAFHYQRDIVHEARGFTINPYKSKLHSMYEIIKTSKSKYQAKFLASYCSRVDFDLSKLDVTADPPTHLVYARFLIDNLAFFDYGRVEDVVYVTSCMEKIVAGTGAGIAHAINTEVFQVRLEPAQEAMNGLTEDETITVAEPTNVTPIVAQQEISPDRLRQLTTGSMILSMLWEARTFIRRLYGVQANHARHENKAKNPKDLTKAPTKNNAITGDKLIEPLYQISQALNNHDLSLNQCRKFAELLAIDNEVKIAAEADDENNDSHFRDSSLEGDSVIMRNGGVKRRGSASASNTPQKKRAKQIMSERKKKSGKIHMNENSDSDY